MDEFASLDVILLLAGSKVNRHCCFVKAVNLLLRLLVLACYAFAFYLSFGQMREKGTISILTVLERYSQEICGLSFIYVINRERKNIQQILTSILPTLNSVHKRALKRHAMGSLLIVILTLIQESVSVAIHLHVTKSVVDVKHIITDVAKSYHYANSWFIGGVCVFTFFVKIVGFSDDNYFKQLSEKKDFESENACQLALERKNVVMMRKQLLSTFSIMPCLWFIHLFIRSSSVTIEVMDRFDDISEKIWRIMPLVYMIVGITYLVYLCDYVTTRIRTRITGLVVKMMTNNSMDRMSVFVSELEKSEAMEFTVWNTFDINRRFSLAFVSSLITFTVLFVQLTYDVIEKAKKAH